MANKLSSENVEQMRPEPLPAGARVITRSDNNPPALLDLLLDELGEANRSNFDKVEPIRAKANALEQAITTDEQLAAWTGVYTEARELWNALDTARKDAKRPYENAINEAFQTRQAPLERITKWVREKADAFNREKIQKQRAAEAAERERLETIERDKRREAEILAALEDSDGALESLSQAHEAREQHQAAAPAKTADVARVRAEGGGVAAAGTVWKFTIDDYSKVDLNAIRHLIPAAAIDKAVGAIVKLQKGATKIEGVKVYEDVATSFRR